MEAHVDQPLGVDAIAKRAGVTPRTLESIFRKSIGETPGAYYLRLRLNAARRLVVDTRVAMADIAARTGFSSAAAFSRAFSRSFGKSADGAADKLSSYARCAFRLVRLDDRSHRFSEPSLQPARHRRVPFWRGVIFARQRHRHQTVDDRRRFMDSIEQRSDLRVEAALRMCLRTVRFHAANIAAIHDGQKAKTCRTDDTFITDVAAGPVRREWLCPARTPAPARQT